MDTPIPDPTAINSWPSALVTIVLLCLVLGLPSVLTYLGNRRVKGLETTLTTNNGGSTVKDALDRIEARQKEHGDLLAAVEGRVTALEGGPESGA